MAQPLPVVATEQLQLMATLNVLNQCYGWGTVLHCGKPAPTRLKDLLTVQ